MPALGPAQPIARAAAPETVGEGIRGCALLQKTQKGWAARCHTSTVVVVVDEDTCRSDECLSLYANDLAKSLGQNPRRAEKTINFAGTNRRVLQLDGVGPSGPGRPDHAIRALVAVVEREEGPRLLGCIAALEDEAHCHSAFDAMAGLPWRADVPVPLARSR